MKTTLKLITLLCFVFISTNCNKNDNETKYEEGLVLYAGDPAVDGCGWKIKINDTIYSPVELSPDFQQDNLRVYVDYRILSPTSPCAWSTTDNPLIEILDMKKQ